MGHSELTDNFLLVEIKIPKISFGLEKPFDSVSDCDMISLTTSMAPPSPSSCCSQENAVSEPQRDSGQNRRGPVVSPRQIFP